MTSSTLTLSTCTNYFYHYFPPQPMPHSALELLFGSAEPDWEKLVIRKFMQLADKTSDNVQVMAAEIYWYYRFASGIDH